MKPRLHISDYYADGTHEDLGETVRFTIRNPTRGVILQQVKHRTKRAGRRTKTRVFYECWSVSPKGRISPAPTDSFFTPCSYLSTAGSITVRAKVWFLPCNSRALRKALSLEDADNAVSGVLPSENGHVPAEYVRRGYTRYWKAKWTGSDNCVSVVSSTNAD